jgi:photosystem II stability/assembly factor-like uncharacterized protein
MLKSTLRYSLIVAVTAATFASAKPAGAQPNSPLSRSALISKMKWRSVGPYVGGRVVAVAGVPGKANLFYAGTVGGGVWKSTNNGISWQNITDGKLKCPSASIGAIAVAPSNPKIIYIGTGEDDIRNDMIPGDGMFKSTDGGKTWHRAGLRDTHSMSVIVVDPKNPDIVYAASMGHVFVPGPHRGVFKSTDGGKTWKKILFVDNKTGAIDLVMDPNHPNVLYATMWQAQRMPWGLISGGPGSGIYKTTDGGAHWTNISRNHGLPTGILGRMGVSVAASNPKIVYAIIQAKHGGVFRSDDAGATWTRVNKEWKLRQRAFYYMTIYTDPKDPNTVYAPNVDAFWVSRDGGKTWKKLHTPHGDNHVAWIDPDNTKILLEGNDGGATVSLDGGKSWSSEHNQPTGQFYHVNLDNQFPFHIYGAQQDEASFEGPSASNGGGIPLSAWHRVAEGEATFVVPQPNDPNITYGSDYFSIFVKYNLKTHEYQSVSPWPVYHGGGSSAQQRYRFGWTHPILFSPANPKELLIGAQDVFKSDDYGWTWTRISPDLTRNEAAKEIPSGGPINLDQSGAEVYPTVFSLAASPLDENLIWAGSDDGLVHVTTDGGKTWQLVTPPGLPDSEISSIEPSHFDKDTAYLTAWRYMWDDFRPFVYKTTDLGKHWTEITRGLPDNQFAFVIRQDPENAKLLFLGTYSTVYVSFNGGNQWQPLKLNLPTAEVRDIAINTRQGDVVAATHGRSIWILDDLKLLEQMTKKPEVAADGSYVFAPETAWLTNDYGGPQRGGRPGMGTNPPYGATVFFHIPANYTGKTPVSLEFKNAQGQVVRKFMLHLATPEQKAQMAGKLTKQQKAKLTHDESGEIAAVQMKKDEALLTAIEPGMNTFQWNLTWPHAVEVTGYHIPEPEDILSNMLNGPRAVPGAYTVVLDYGGHVTQQAFTIALDPRLKATQQDLEAELNLGLRIQKTLQELDEQLNAAIAARTRLQQAVTTHRLSEARAADSLKTLNTVINSVLQTKISSSEGDLVNPVKLRGFIAYLAEDVNWAYGRPTPAQYAAYQRLNGEAKAADQKLASAIADATQLAN